MPEPTVPGRREARNCAARCVIAIASLGLLVILLGWSARDRLVQRLDQHRQAGACETMVGWPADGTPCPASWWHESVALQLEQDRLLPAGHWLLFGDSLVEGINVHALGSGIVNYGIGGDTVTGLRYRLPRYASLAGARGLVLLIGISDMKYRNDDRILDAMRELLRAIPAHLSVTCVALLPIDESRRVDWESRSNVRIREYNAALATLCLEEGASYVDPGAALRDDRGALAPAYHRGDGLHLSPAGYRALLGPLRSHLAATGGPPVAP